MLTKEFIGQLFGIVGLLMFVLSFQCKENKKLILVRGPLYMKKDNKIWKPVVVEILFTIAYVYSLSLVKDSLLQIVLTTLPYLSLLVMSVLMWKDDGKKIRIFQTVALSPSWLIHNIFNFTLGGILAEIFNIISAVVSLIRFKEKDDTF